MLCFRLNWPTLDIGQYEPSKSRKPSEGQQREPFAPEENVVLPEMCLVGRKPVSEAYERHVNVVSMFKPVAKKRLSSRRRGL